jgi:HEAT repeat protein
VSQQPDLSKLAAGLKSGDEVIRRWCAAALSSKGAAAAGAVPALREMLHSDRDVRVREAAELALKRIGQALASSPTAPAAARDCLLASSEAGVEAMEESLVRQRMNTVRFVALWSQLGCFCPWLLLGLAILSAMSGSERLAVFLGSLWMIPGPVVFLWLVNRPSDLMYLNYLILLIVIPAGFLMLDLWRAHRTDQILEGRSIDYGAVFAINAISALSSLSRVFFLLPVLAGLLADRRHYQRSRARRSPSARGDRNTEERTKNPAARIRQGTSATLPS